MSAFNDDTSRLKIFKELHRGHPTVDETHMRTFEWEQWPGPGVEVPLERAHDLGTRPQCALRLILAPLDLATSTRAADIHYLFETYSFPSQFISERLQSVAHSFGTRTTNDGITDSWFHFLCKNIHLERDPDNPERVEIQNPVRSADGLIHHQSQSDFSWIRMSCFLRVESLFAPDPSKQCAEKSITLICFGAPDPVVQRFRHLLKQSGWNHAMSDPYILFDIVFDELYLVLDTMGWLVADVFGGLERRVLNQASYPGLAAEKIDFVGLSNIAKHIIYLRESADAALYTVDAMVEAHRAAASATGDEFYQRETDRSLAQRKSVIHSTSLRLRSMDERCRNLIQLSFNLVTQQDSRSFQVDNKLMKLIALATLVFLPTTTISSIFGSQFFVFNSDSGNGTVNANRGTDLKISRQFWVFWVLTLPLTVFVLCAAYLYFKSTEAKIIGKRQPRRTLTGISMVDSEKGTKPA